MQALTRLVMALSIVAFSAALSGAEPMTEMPPSPTDSKDYLNKWDPFVLKPLTGTKEALSRNNGRQIARDSQGTWHVLIEKDRQALHLGVARGERVVGGDFEMMELVGKSSKATFKAEGDVVGGSMVIDKAAGLHVIWCDKGAVYYANRSAGRSAWAQARRLSDPLCHLGDIMLDATGKVVVSYSRADTVYYLSLPDGRPEAAGGVGAGMAPLVTPVLPQPTPRKDLDPAAPLPQAPKTPSYPPPMPLQERECRSAVMDLGPDGSVHLAFQRDFDIWYAHRTPDGKWLPPERAAWGLAFHPAIIAAGDKPLICFQYEGLRKVQLGGPKYLQEREGGGSSIGCAFRSADGWRTGYLARAEEIIVNRQDIWEKRYEGKLLAMVEEMWRPVLFRDRHGVPWALWQNTTRRWAYCARWLGQGFGEVQECRGPFNAPGQPVSAEKVVPQGASDVGLLFFSANRVIFDRLKIPALSLSEEREVLFLDSLEVAETEGVGFVLNPMTKHPANPLLSPGSLGSKDDRHVFNGQVSKHGDTYVMSYSYQSWAESGYKSGALAVSKDGAHWQKVEKLPDDVPRGDGVDSSKVPTLHGYFDNPDASDPAKKYMRINTFGPVWYKGSKRIVYSPDGRNWADGPEVSILNAIYEGTTPNLWDPLDIPERRIKIYGRVFSTNARSCGMMWSRDLVHWEGAEHPLDPDDPYGKPLPKPGAGPLRGQIFLDACAGKGEDQIYSASVRIVDGLYLCLYLPCSFEHRYDAALAVSRDGFNFTRVKNGGRTLPVGPAGAWDSGAIKMSWPGRDGDVLRGYYGGGAWHHGVEPYRPAWHIGLATIRVNGWTYYTPQPEAYRGAVTTIPIEAPAGARTGLTVNIEGITGGAGSFAVEVLDVATGRPMDGFAVRDCETPKADGIAVPIAWKGGRTLPAGKTIRLAFHLSGRGVRLYSFGLRKDS